MKNEEPFVIIGQDAHNDEFGFLGEPFSDYDNVEKKLHSYPYQWCDYDSTDILTFTCEHDAQEAAEYAVKKGWAKTTIVAKICKAVTVEDVIMCGHLFRPLTKKN